MGKRKHKCNLCLDEKTILLYRGCDEEGAVGSRLCSCVTDELDTLRSTLTTYKKQLGKSNALLYEFIDDEECRFDHHGYCQSHSLTSPCVVAQTREFLDGQLEGLVKTLSKKEE
jgi:hypothetical protein